MNRIAFFSLLVFWPNVVLSQWFFGGDYHVSLYKPFSSEYELKSNNRHRIVDSYSFSNKFYNTIKLNESQTFGLGLSYTQTGLTHNNFVDSVIVYHSSYGPNPQVVDTTTVYFPISLKETSMRLGIYFDYNYAIFMKKKTSGFLGVSSVISLYEYAFSRFENELKSLNTDSTDPMAWEAEYNYPGGAYNPSIYSDFSHVYFSSAELAFFYRQLFQIRPNFNIAFRLSLNTNLYSDWDQFKKYVWLGLGVEVGFGKAKILGERKNQQ